MFDYDFLLDKVGDFRGYQIAVTLGFLYFGIPIGLNSIASVFIAYTPEYRCQMYPFDNSSLYPDLTSDMVMNMTTPLDEDGNPEDACVKYGYNASECTPADMSCVNTSVSTVTCDEYYYDDSLFTSTVVTEFDLVCDRRVLNTLGSSMYMLGFLIGSVLFGYLSDRFGRKITTVGCSYMMLLLMLGVAYCHSVELFIVGRFLVGLFGIGANVAIFSHLMEIVGSKWRTLVGVAFHMTYALGYMLWSGIAYLYRDWHQMTLGSLVVSTPLGIIVLIIPESARWLFTNGKDKQGKKVILTMAKLNRVDLPESVWQEAEKSKEYEEEKDDKYSTIDLFRTQGLRNLTFRLAFIWAVTSMVYYGISLNVGSLAGDIFLNNIYVGVFEISSYVVCIFVMDPVGRRLLLTITLTGGGIALVASTIVNEYADGNSTLVTLGVAFALFGKALVSASFAVIYNFTGEVYPTVVRSNGLGFGSMAARIGSILSPFIIALQDYVSWLPNTIFGVFAVVGGVLSLSFRDTTGRPMMETIEEAELFYARKENTESIDTPNTFDSAYENKTVMLDDEKEKISTAL